MVRHAPKTAAQNNVFSLVVKGMKTDGVPNQFGIPESFLALGPRVAADCSGGARLTLECLANEPNSNVRLKVSSDNAHWLEIPAIAGFLTTKMVTTAESEPVYPPRRRVERWLRVLSHHETYLGATCVFDESPESLDKTCCSKLASFSQRLHTRFTASPASTSRPLNESHQR